tara:strand:+ start:284 stop:544 length:261 start_codon:yes stop_codon:yes gene_type:complete
MNLFFIPSDDSYWKIFNDGFCFYDSQLPSNWSNYSRYCLVNPNKQHAKLRKLQAKAEACLSREEAQKIIKKSDKANHKLSASFLKG